MYQEREEQQAEGTALQTLMCEGFGMFKKLKGLGCNIMIKGMRGTS